MRAWLQPEGFSRRRFVGYGAGSLAWAHGLARAQSVVPPAPGESPDDAARIAAASDAAKHLTVPVMINGEGPFHFVIDTGADRSVIADDVAVNLGLARGNLVTVQGVVRSLDTRLVKISDLSFGPVRRRNMDLPILARALVRADGYLGLDAVDGFRVTLDFRDRELVIGSSRRKYPFDIIKPSEALVPLRGSMGHLRSLNCRVDGVATTCFMDTGAEISVGNTRLLSALLDENPGYVILGELPITGITGGVITGSVIHVDKVRLHGVVFSDCNLLIADMQIFNIWNLADQPALLIGMNFLRQFAQVSIDYGLKEIRFDLASMVIARNT